MEQYKVLVTAKSFAVSDNRPLQLLEEAGCRVINLTRSDGDLHENIIRELPGTHAVIAGVEPYDRATLNAADSIRVISRYGVGCDSIDRVAAKEMGIVITRTPGANEESVADYAMALMLGTARNLTEMDSSIKSGKTHRPMGREMWRKTLGVIGLGRIGKGVVRRARGFDMNILCYDLVEDQEFASGYNVTYCPLERLLRESDYVTIHAPLTETTRNMIGGYELRTMKSSAILINTARGGIINEDELLLALKEKSIAGAGLDVTVHEPPLNSPLARLPNCIITPHAGAATYEASNNMSIMAAENVLDVLLRGNCVNALG